MIKFKGDSLIQSRAAPLYLLNQKLSLENLRFIGRGSRKLAETSNLSDFPVQNSTSDYL